MKARHLPGVVLLTAVIFAVPATGGTVPFAAGGRVQLLQSSVVSPRARRCLTRLREELTAGGFQVAISEFGAGGDALWMVDPPSPRDGSLATMALVGNPDEGPAELWIVDGVAGGRAAVRRLLVPAGSNTHDDEVLAIRTLEFLRASALELARGAAATSTPTPTVAPATAASTASTASTVTPPAGPAIAAAAGDQRALTPLVPASSPGPLSFELGVSLLEGSRSLGPAYLPVARLRAELASLLETRLTLAGLGTRPHVTSVEGTATVDHTFGLVELRAVFRRGRAIRPAVGIGAGALLVQVDGAGYWPYEGRRGHAWAGLFDVSAGLTLALGRRLAVALDAHGQIAGPAPTVQIHGQEAARIGRPALLTSLTMVTPL